MEVLNFLCCFNQRVDLIILKYLYDVVTTVFAGDVVDVSICEIRALKVVIMLSAMGPKLSEESLR